MVTTLSPYLKDKEPKRKYDAKLNRAGHVMFYALCAIIIELAIVYTIIQPQ